MTWLVAGLVGIIAVALYTAAINREFLRCPHCRKIGSWRFDNLGPASKEYDEDDGLQRVVQRRACRRCGGEVIHEWSDYSGRSIRKA